MNKIITRFSVRKFIVMAVTMISAHWLFSVGYNMLKGASYVQASVGYRFPTVFIAIAVAIAFVDTKKPSQ